MKNNTSEESSIICSPMQIVKSCSKFLALVIILLLTSAFTVTATGSFWIAQTLSRLSDGSNRLELKLCCTNGVDPTSPFCLQSPQCPLTHGTF